MLTLTLDFYDFSQDTEIDSWFSVSAGRDLLL